MWTRKEGESLLRERLSRYKFYSSERKNYGEEKENKKLNKEALVQIMKAYGNI